VSPNHDRDRQNASGIADDALFEPVIKSSRKDWIASALPVGTSLNFS